MRVFALIALICVFASAAMAQTADGSGWVPSDPHGVIDETSAQWMNKPGRYLVIKIPSGTFEVQPVELWLDARGVRHDQAFADAFTQNRITWPQSLSVRRYDTDKMVKALQRFRGDSEAFLRYQVKLRGVRRANEVRQVPMSEVKILRLPQTWENIWMREVASVPAQERVARVKEFDFGFRAVIENRDSELEFFSRPEQNAYALFYQSQFNYQRNAEPNNAAIYHELAAYHESRDNIDAKIGVYLDAVRHDFESEEKELFHLLIGEAMVKRLRLYQEAKAHLKSASSYAAANLLLVECHFALGENDEAVAAANTLSPEGIERLALRESGDDMDQIQRRATLLKARAQVAQHQLDKAEASFKSELSDEGIAGDEAATMLASLLIYRGESRDYGDAVRVINNRASFAKRIGEARLTPEAREKIELEYDPIGSRALTLLADAQVDGAVDARSSSRPQLKDINVLLDYAAILDPLNPEPFLVHGKAREIHQLWADAEGAYLDGLQIDPLHAGLNYRLGVLYMRAERTDSAADAFRRALRREPRFTAAMNRLADLALLRGDEALAEMRNAQFEGNADLAPYLNRITEAQQEAASFYANSLALDDDQAAVRVALAELFCRLASAADDELRSSYLNRARTLSARARSQLRQELQAPASTRRNDQASTTPLDANTIFAYASYQLGAIRYYQSLNDGDIAGFAEAEALHAEAIDALSFIDDSTAQRHYQTRTGAKDFKTSDVYLWAKYWREQLIMNQRRSRDLDSFNRTVTRESFEIDEVLGNGWGVQEGETLDAGVKGNCEVSGSKLVVRQGNQVEDGHISRISRADANNRIARFGVTIPRLGLSLTDRGMHLTIVRGANRSGQSRKPAESLMLGLDENFRVFWEFRTLEGEGNESKGKTLLEAGERIYLEDPAFNGLNENSSLTLEVSRYLEEGASSLRYSLFVNGVEFPIDLSNSSPILNQAGKNLGRSFSAVNNFKRKSQVAVYMGVFLRGREGDTGQIEVSEASWIYDSNMAWEKDD